MRRISRTHGNLTNLGTSWQAIGISLLLQRDKRKRNALHCDARKPEASKQKPGINILKMMKLLPVILIAAVITGAVDLVAVVVVLACGVP